MIQHYKYVRNNITTCRNMNFIEISMFKISFLMWILDSIPNNLLNMYITLRFIECVLLDLREFLIKCFYFLEHK